MGGRPLLALSVTAFPEELPVEMLGEILAGAAEAVREAGAILAGGHTIRDEEPKYGLAVVGTVHPDGVWRKSTAEAGDVVLLTKALGTGLVLQGVRDGVAPAGALEAATEAMCESNRDAADALRSFTPHAVTDVTGFGLLGHAHETASRSGVRIVLDAGRAARAARRAGARRRPASAPAATAGTASSPARTSTPGRPRSSRRSPTTRRRRAGFSSRCRPTSAPSSRRRSPARGLPLHAVGRVEAGAGVALA